MCRLSYPKLVAFILFNRAWTMRNGLTSRQYNHLNYIIFVLCASGCLVPQLIHLPRLSGQELKGEQQGATQQKLKCQPHIFTCSLRWSRVPLLKQQEWISLSMMECPIPLPAISEGLLILVMKSATPPADRLCLSHRPTGTTHLTNIKEGETSVRHLTQIGNSLD